MVEDGITGTSNIGRKGLLSSRLTLLDLDVNSGKKSPVVATDGTEWPHATPQPGDGAAGMPDGKGAFGFFSLLLARGLADQAAIAPFWARRYDMAAVRQCS